MKQILFLLICGLFATSCTRFLPSLYRTKVPGDPTLSYPIKPYQLSNGLVLHLYQGHFICRAQKGFLDINAGLTNPEDSTLAIQRQEFSLRSAKGILYHLKPYGDRYYVNGGPTKKHPFYPTEYPVKGRMSAYYSFFFETDSMYTVQTMTNTFFSDTFYLVHTTAAQVDTVMTLVAYDPDHKKARQPIR